jgi:hypothetical protein
MNHLERLGLHGLHVPQVLYLKQGPSLAEETAHVVMALLSLTTCTVEDIALDGTGQFPALPSHCFSP